MRPKRISVLGVPVDCVTMTQALDFVDELIAGEEPQSIIAVNPEKVIKAQSDHTLLGSLRDAGLLIPDGIGIVLAARALGLGSMERVPGSELMPAICARAAEKGYRIFLFGASPETNRLACEALRSRHRTLQLVGAQHGFVAEEEMDNVVKRINESGAQILFIALGSPKQELWMARHLPALKVPVCQGVGGTFDVLAGRTKRAPAALRRMNLEWLYRLLSQPKRLLRQTALPKFAYQVVRTRLKG